MCEITPGEGKSFLQFLTLTDAASVVLHFRIVPLYTPRKGLRASKSGSPRALSSGGILGVPKPQLPSQTRGA